MDDVLTTDDPLYEQLYDVRQEAENMGNYVALDTMPDIHILRAQDPVHKGKLREILNLPHHNRHSLMEGRQHWTALTYEANKAVFRDPKTYSSRISQQPNPENEFSHSILEMDPPMHRAIRRTIQPKFLMPEVAGWWREYTIDTIVDRLIERLKGRERADLNMEFCARIPVYTITTAIGLEGDEALRFRHAHVNSVENSNVDPQVRQKNALRVQEILLNLIEKRQKKPTSDLVSTLLSATVQQPGEDPRPLTDREVMHMAKIVMIAGGGTSWRQMGITLLALLNNPDQLELVKADHALLDDAVEESLRWNPTAPYFYRLATQDTELCGHAIGKGDVIELGVGPANRDPARWDEPDTYDMRRPKRSNLAFGLGVHRCLGMNVAKVEMMHAIGALFDAFPDIRLDTDAPMPKISGGFEQRGPTAVPVILR
ncbi:MAG: cytochrome P450 [Sphingomonadaceae bacterium]|nr:cytochrome P450 [Sphingomonadaceae bacterium]